MDEYGRDTIGTQIETDILMKYSREFAERIKRKEPSILERYVSMVDRRAGLCRFFDPFLNVRYISASDRAEKLKRP